MMKRAPSWKSFCKNSQKLWRVDLTAKRGGICGKLIFIHINVSLVYCFFDYLVPSLFTYYKSGILQIILNLTQFFEMQ